MNDLATVPTVSTPPALTLEFRGDAKEYFRIWIVNVALSVVTLGIYSAWAKVRTKRYFYGNTQLDGAVFEYHATPKQILIGRLIAVAGIGIYYGATYLNPIVGYVLLGLWMLVAPWVINSSLRFNARVSSYRNVRFDFEGSYWRSLLVFVVLPVLAALTLGLLAPVAHRAANHYVARGYRFGGRAFAARLPLGRYYLIYLQGFGIFLVLITAFVAVGTWVTWGKTPQEMIEGWTMQIMGWVFSGGLYLLLVPFVRAKVRNVVYGRLELDGRHRFASGLSPWRVIWIILSNVVAAVATLGLLVPWAKVRYARYVASHTAIMPGSDLSEFVAVLASGRQALGSELSDIAGLEIGI